MKKLFLFLAILIISITCIGQNVPMETPQAISTYKWEEHPYAKGNWQFLFQEYASVNNQQYEYDGEDQGSATEVNLNFGTKYFVADHIAVGLSVMYGADKYNSVLDAIYKTNDYMVWGNFTYMRGLSSNISIYGEAAVGFGGLKESYEEDDFEEEDSYSRFGYKFTAGLPIRVARNSPLYFTPQFQYRGITTDYDDGKEKDNRFGLNMRFETYLPCSAKGWDTNGRWSSDRYRQGQSILGYTTRSGISFGSYTFEYDEDYDDEETDFFQAKLEGEYLYYIINNLALGAQVRVNSRSYEYDNGFESSRTVLSFRPTVEYNMPGKARNLFIRAGYGFGTDNYTEEYNGNEDEDKIKFTSWGAHLGYNIFMARRISLTPMIGYESRSEKYEDDDEKQTGKGLDFAVGLRYHF